MATWIQMIPKPAVVVVLTHLGLGHERVHALLMAALYTYGPFDHASDKEQWQLETHL